MAGAGPALLLAIALLCTFYPGLHHTNVTVAKPTPVFQPPAAQPAAKPSPISPAVIARSEAPTVPERPANTGSISRRTSPAHDHSISFEATHKKPFGSCTGELTLSSAALHFSCSRHPDLDIPVSFIAAAHKDGVVVASGERYHFLIANHTKGQVEMIFSLWLNRARQSHPPSGELSF